MVQSEAGMETVKRLATGTAAAALLQIVLALCIGDTVLVVDLLKFAVCLALLTAGFLSVYLVMVLVEHPERRRKI